MKTSPNYIIPLRFAASRTIWSRQFNLIIMCLNVLLQAVATKFGLLLHSLSCKSQITNHQNRHQWPTHWSRLHRSPRVTDKPDKTNMTCAKTSSIHLPHLPHVLTLPHGVSPYQELHTKEAVTDMMAVHVAKNSKTLDIYRPRVTRKIAELSVHDRRNDRLRYRWRDVFEIVNLSLACLVG